MALTNNIRLIGHCAENPIVLGKPEGKIAKVSVYTKHWWKDQKGVRREQQEIHRCLFFGFNAEKAVRFLQKGTQVHLEGTIHYETRTRPDQSKAYYTNIMVQDFDVADRIAISKEMYQNIFPGEEPNRVESGNTRAEIENFDQESARIENYKNGNI